MEVVQKYFVSNFSHTYTFVYRFSTMSDCWVEIPDKRPTFSDLVTTLSTALEGIAGYLDFTTETQEQLLLHGSGYDLLDPTQTRPVLSVGPSPEGHDQLNPTIVVTDAGIGNDPVKSNEDDVEGDEP